MGPNLIPKVENFSIENHTAKDHEIGDGCITPGTHKVLRFDFLTQNVGDKDFVVGRPVDRPDLFEFSTAHGHYHMKKFNQYNLYDVLGNLVVPSKKLGFCLIDVKKVFDSAGPAKYTSCSATAVMGISVGWADLYASTLDCQFLVIDGVPDGDYTLVSITNTARAILEDNFDDNTVCQGLHIEGQTVSVLSNPPIHADLTTATVNFDDVPEGETALRPVEFTVLSCGPVSFKILSGPTKLTGPLGTVFGTLTSPGAFLADDHSLLPRNAFLWLTYTGTSAGDVATGTVDVGCIETGQRWTVPIVANTVKRPSVAVMLVLDQSGSMGWPAGTGTTRINVLHDAASRFVQLAQPNNGVGIVRFDDKAFLADGILPLTPASNQTKLVHDIVATAPHGATSIGNGLELARTTIDPVVGYNRKAIIVFTDGLENTSKFIADVRGLITDTTYAIGLGTAQQVSTSALTALTNGTGGYLLVSGALSTAVDDYFRLSKYFLQILAAVTNINIVTDPSGYITMGQKVRIPFTLTLSDIEATVVLMTDTPIVQLALETPVGHIIGPAEAISLGVTVAAGTNMVYYRFRLPLVVDQKPVHAGVWHAVLAIGEWDNRAFIGPVRGRGARYNLSVHAYSNVRMTASLTQNSFEPGARINVRARLTEFGVPLAADTAKVHAELHGPGSALKVVWFTETEPSVFETEVSASIAGTYQFRVIANGLTHRGEAFVREQLLSASVAVGGNSPSPSTPPRDRGGDLMCSLLKCLLHDQGLGRLLEQHTINASMLENCLQSSCEAQNAPPSDRELAEREGIPFP
ncbi:MAG: hypothetical protein M1839_001071 [Geoglossum umbratile]|nr:MAG: hypothetical protein M1839_001071 [Geoglossum umbratile]